MKKRNQGLTLYELVVTLLVIAALLSAGLPSLGKIGARQRQSAEINALFNAIHRARKESITRRKVVSLCPTVDRIQCADSKDWSSGWLMFENADRDSPPRVDVGESVLKVHQVTENIDISANRKGFTLRATFLRATNGTFVVCDASDRVPTKALVVSYTGRPRVAVHRRDGELYSCAD